MYVGPWIPDETFGTTHTGCKTGVVKKWRFRDRESGSGKTSYTVGAPSVVVGLLRSPFQTLPHPGTVLVGVPEPVQASGVDGRGVLMREDVVTLGRWTDDRVGIP